MDIVAGFQALIAVFPKIVYLLTMSILGVIDVFQLLFRKLAGLDCYYVDGTAQTGDLIYDFLRGILFGGYPILSNVFFGLLILGFILLFLSTIVAIIRNEYTTEKADNTKGKIIGKAFKSVIYFAIVPVVVLFGVYLANVVLVAVDRATTYNVNYGNTLDKSKLQAVDVASVPIVGQSTGQKTYTTYSLLGFRDANGLPYGTTTTTFSGTIFKAAAYGANRVRTTMNVADETQNFGLLLKTNQATNFNGLFSDPSGNLENIAVRIDIAFADNVVFAQSVQQTLDYSSAYAENNNPTGIDPFAADRTTVYTVADKFDVGLVWYYYDLWQFNYIIALGAAIIMVTIFINIIFGLMRRIIEMIGLFLMAPPLIALMPLDNEKAYGSWRGSFIKKALMAYGAVGGMNIILLLLPELQKISFFNITPLDWIVDTLLVLVALLAVKDFIDVVSGFAGGENAQKSGEGVAKDVGDLAAKGAKFAASAVGVAAGVGAAGVAGAKALGGLALKAAPYAGKAVRGAGHLAGKFGGAAIDTVKGVYSEIDDAKLDKKATKRLYEEYKKERASDMERTMPLDPRMGSWEDMKKRDPALYADLLHKHLKKDFDERLTSGYTAAGVPARAGEKSLLDRKHEILSELREEELAKAAARKEARKESWEHSGVRDAGKFIHDKAAPAVHFVGKNAPVVAGAVGKGVAGTTKFVKDTVVNISQPITSSTKNFYDITMSTMMDNAFLNSLRGKDGENIKDIGYRLQGKTLAEINKLKDSAKKEKESKEKDEAAKDHAKLMKNIDAILAALKKNENAIENLKEDSEKE